MTGQLSKRYLARLLILAVLFAALFGYALFNTASEGNRVEAENAEKMVARLIDAEAKEMTLVAGDNALWDSAAEAVYTGKDPQFAWNSWGSATAEKRYYSVVSVVNAADKSMLGYFEGKPELIDVAAELGENYPILARRATLNQKAAGGIVKTKRGIFVVGVADILPISRNLDHIIPKEGPHRIVFMRELTGDVLVNIGEVGSISDLRFGRMDNNSDGIDLTDVSGKVIAQLAWTSQQSGMKALWRSLPQIALAALLIIFAALLVARNSYESLRLLGTEAFVDSLSDLPNRRSLKNALSDNVDKKLQTALAMMDLDGFKGVNDSYGHQMGDTLISEVAAFLKQTIQDDGIVARLGGDEFAILMTGWDSAQRIEAACQKILARFAAPFELDAASLNVGVSIGIDASNGSTSAGELMRRADIALYAAKRAGKMRISWFDENLDQLQSKAHEMESDLRVALARGEFTIAYQPTLSVDASSITSIEAFLRWVHPTRGEISAAEFVPVAEETGLIDHIGMWVIENASRDALEWGAMPLTINVSPSQLRNPSFARNIAAILDNNEFPAARLQLEITERFLIMDAEAAKRVIGELRQLGISIALDDYGAGFASVGFLRDFAFSKMKIDRSLVKDSETSAAARAVLQASVTVARALELQVVASGVESSPQADLMRVVGCDELQGWHFAKAMSAEQMTERLGLANDSLRSSRRQSA